MAGFHIEHFGCRAARADGEAMAGNLRALHAREPLAADVVIVNTCSVTAEADRAARAFIRRAHRKNPAAKIVVTGCYAQRASEELAAMAGVTAVVGNSHRALVPEIILGLTRGEELTYGAERMTSAASPVPICERPGAPAVVPVASLLAPGGSSAPIWADDRFAHSFIEDVHWGEMQHGAGAQTRPNLKIQEGCSNRCSFCVIPWTRGASRSLPAASVFKQVEGFVAAGGVELVLSGINLGRWGRDFSPLPDGSPANLATLVRHIFERTELPRLRLSSIEPMDWDEELIELMAEFGGTRLARHAHLPLQSGSDAVLHRMHRRYRPWHYAEKVDALLQATGPELTLGADVMVGFPGETDAEFEETVAFIRALPFGYLHLFPFSPRPGTRAWALHSADPVAAGAVAERMARLRTLAAEKTVEHRRQFVGRELEALTLNTPENIRRLGRTVGLTENFLPFEVDGELRANQRVSIEVTGVTAEGALTHSRSSSTASCAAD